MGQPLQPRVIHAGPYKPTVPRTGDDSDSTFRMGNAFVRGRGRYYWESFSGLGDLGQNLAMVPLTGTLTLTQDSTTVTGSSTLFNAECHLGQWICAIASDGSTSWSLRVRKVVSDTEMQIWKAPDSSTVGATGWRQPRLNASNQDRFACLTGREMPLEKGSYLGAGSGVAYLNGSAFNASWTLQRSPSINLFNATTGTFTNFLLGMATPSAPTLAAVGGGSKNMQAGSYSAVITPARTTTGGYNNPSPRADVTIATGDKVQFTLPAADTSNGQDGWFLWVTTFSFSIGSDLNYLNGPWFLWPAGSGPGGMVVAADISGGLGGGTFTTEWLDAEVEVNEIVSFNNDPPTDAEGVVQLNNQPFWYSCQGQGNTTTPTQTSPGPFIIPAKPNNIEAAPLDLAFSSSPPETILWAVPGNGRIYLLTVNHLQLAQATPDQDIPILIRPFWHNGFAGPDQLTLIGEMLYGVPLGGPTRSSENGDESTIQRDWAADIWEELPSSPNIGHCVCGYDPENEAFILVYSGSERNPQGFWKSEWWAYGIPQQFWIGHGEFDDPTRDQIVSGIATIGDRLSLLIGGREA